MNMTKLSMLVQSAIQGIIGLIELLLGLRLVMRLFGANSSNDFVSWVYDTSASILQPFENIFPTVRIEDGYVLELSTLFAMLIYAVIALALTAFVAWVTAAIEPSKKKK